MSIRKNYIYSVSYQILLVILPLLTAPYLARVIGAEGVGIYAYTYTIAHYFFMFSKLGLNNYGTRSIARAKNDTDYLSRIFSEIYFQQLIIGLLVAFIYMLYVIFISKTDPLVTWIQLTYVISVAVDIDWFFFGMEKFKRITIRNFIVKILMTFCVLTFVNSKNDIWIYALIISIGVLASNLSIWIGIRKIITLKRVSLRSMLSHIKPSLVLFIPVVATSIFRSFDKIMIGSISGMIQVGIYENAEKIVYLLLGFISALGKVSMPRISNLLSENKHMAANKYIRKSMTFSMFISSALAFGIAAIAPEFIPIFYGEGFYGSIIILQCLSGTIVLIAWANVIRTQYIIPMEKDYIYIKAVVYGAMINVVINLALIRTYGALGAVVGTICAEFFVPLYQTINVRKELPISLYLKQNVVFIIFGWIMYIVVRYIAVGLDNGILSVLLQMVIGAIVYLMLSGAYFYHMKKCLK